MLKGKKVYTLGQNIYPGIYLGKLQRSKYLGIYLVKQGKYDGKYSSVVGRGGLDF